MTLKTKLIPKQNKWAGDLGQLVECLSAPISPWVLPPAPEEPGVVMPAYSPSIWEAEAGRWEIEDQSSLAVFQASLRDISPCSENKPQTRSCRSYRDGSTVKNNWCFAEDNGFGSQHTLDGSQPSVIPPLNTLEHPLLTLVGTSHAHDILTYM